jgi:hypothetical protein
MSETPISPLRQRMIGDMTVRAGAQAFGSRREHRQIPRTRLAPMTDLKPCSPLRAPCCGGRMILIETFEAGCQPRHAPTFGIDTS